MNYLRRHPITTFLVFTFVISAVITVFQSAIGLDTNVLTLVQFAPTFGALVAWMISRQTVAGKMPSLVSRRQVIIHTLLALVACALFAAILYAWSYLLNIPRRGVGSVAGTPFIVVFVLQLIGAAGEEVGWRGFLQPMLESRWSRLRATTVTGAIWGVWHIPALLSGPIEALLFLIMTVAFGVLIGYLGNGSPVQRVTTTAITHWLVNIAILVILGTDLDTPKILGGMTVSMILTTAIFGFVYLRANARPTSLKSPR